MAKTKTIMDAVNDYIIPTGSNPCYGDPFYYKSICEKYGQEKIDELIDQVKQKRDFFFSQIQYF